MRVLAAAVAALVVSGCQASPERAPSAQAETAADQDLRAMQGDRYGEALTLEEITPVSTILDEPDGWVGRRVLVQGMVVAVCEKRGCWMDIASDREFEKIQIKVDDGVIVFPLSAKGKRALVEGVVERLDLTAEEALEDARGRPRSTGRPSIPHR